MYRVRVVVMLRSPSSGIKVSSRTETGTTSDTSLPTWYRTIKLSGRLTRERLSCHEGPSLAWPVRCSAGFGLFRHLDATPGVFWGNHPGILRGVRRPGPLRPPGMRPLFDSGLVVVDGHLLVALAPLTQVVHLDLDHPVGPSGGVLVSEALPGVLNHDVLTSKRSDRLRPSVELPDVVAVPPLLDDDPLLPREGDELLV